MSLMKLWTYILGCATVKLFTEAVVLKEEKGLNWSLGPHSAHRKANDQQNSSVYEYPPNQLYGPVRIYLITDEQLNLVVCWMTDTRFQDPHYSTCMPIVAPHRPCPPALAEAKPVHDGFDPLCYVPGWTARKEPHVALPAELDCAGFIPQVDKEKAGDEK
ncbi:hypothetical protein Pmar_PMAR017139 [Perkinsus marinus ATCC 50983]|uniref:Secreted protein n=1 Tax=Perkinsus marinus (strain ATCC 50983 / TXsc) TaxID=423536 RepID=C5LSP0_PERM5|nr:hypothetical protein Pmar_PMAR017139 [Perkinsus marinus ATCC 50983]EER00281.1 hypothetical protein Pmar_PMAR017139 [Perkinsus marinus ATCC 50983]|eukprot:XP_002767563.1 hypothetical protein Pmar_PMAR017139 [Perkinsus marinus ATCC 50983]